LGFIFVSVFPWFIFGLHYYIFLASLLRNLGCIAARQIRFSGKSPTRLGEVLHMFNGGAANVLWICIFTTFFMLQCLRRVSGEVRGGAANVQQQCYKYSVALLLLLHFLCFNVSCEVSGEIGGFAANVQRWCNKYFCGSASLLHFLCFNVSGEVSGESPMRAPTRSGEVLQMFNGGAANILWLCFFTTFFVLQFLRRGLRRVSDEVSGEVHVQQVLFYLVRIKPFCFIRGYLCFNEAKVGF
jgi:hypothetical protein